MNEVIDRSLVEFNGNESEFGKAFLNSAVDFTINDIELPVAPLHISVQKEDLNYSYKTLRTKKSVKVGSGKGVYNLQLSLLFPKETIIMLHRLVIQVRNNPFVFIKNQYIKNLLDPKLYEGKNLFFTVTNLHIKTYDQYPDAYIANMDLRFFNYVPYSNFLKYKKEFISLLGNTKYTIPVWSETAVAFEAQEEDQRRSGSSRRLSQGIVLEESSRFEETYAVVEPKESNVFVRYYNYLQLKALEKNFNITRNSIKDQLDEKTSKAFELGYNGVVLGIHSKFLPLSVKNYIIGEMLNTDNNVRFYYNEYQEVKLSKQALQQLKERRDTFVSSEPANRNTSRDFRESLETQLKNYIENNRFSFIEETDLKDVAVVKTGETSFPNSRAFGKQYISPIQFEGSISRREAELFSNTNILNINFNKIQYIFAPFGGEGCSALREGNDLILSLEEKRFVFKNVEEVPGLLEDDFTLNIQQGQAIGVAVRSPLQIEIQNNDFELSSIVRMENENISSPTLSNQEILLDELSLFEDLIFKDNFKLLLQENVTNVFYRSKSLEIPNEGAFDEAKDSFLINFSGSFQNLISSIPIASLEYPTHQFLGSIEPNYMFNFISKENLIGTAGFSYQFETMRATLAENSRRFKNIYDSGHFIIECFITKLLGTYEHGSYVNIQEKSQGEGSRRTEDRFYNELVKKNFIISSVSDETIEGLPGATSSLIRVSETGSINDERISEVTSTKEVDRNSDETNNAIYQNALEMYRNLKRREGQPLQARAFVSENSDPRNYNWRTQKFTADIWYSKARKKGGGFNRQDLSIAQDKVAFLFCTGILDKLKFYYADKEVNLFSTFGNRSETVSHHEVNAAVDLRVRGVNVAEVAAVVEILLEEGIARNLVYQEDGNERVPDARKYIGMGVYGNLAHDPDIKMNGTKSHGFVHIDMNIDVEKLLVAGAYSPSEIQKANVRSRRWLGKDNADKFEDRSFWTETFPAYKTQIRPAVLEKINSVFGRDLQNDIELEEVIDEDDNNLETESMDRVGLPNLISVTTLQDGDELEKLLDNNPNLSGVELHVTKIDYDSLPESIRNQLPIESDKEYFLIKNRGFLGEETLLSNSEKTELLETARLQNYISIGSSQVENLLGQTANRFYFTRNRGGQKALSQEYEEEQNFKAVIKMIGEFENLANFILTEPSVYADDPQEELIRIKRELFGLEVKPELYSYIASICEKLNENIFGRWDNAHYKRHTELFKPFFENVLNVKEREISFLEENDFHYAYFYNTYFVQNYKDLESGIQDLIFRNIIKNPILENYLNLSNELTVLSDLARIINFNFLDKENASLTLFSNQILLNEEIRKVFRFAFDRSIRRRYFVATNENDIISFTNKYPNEAERFTRSENTLFNLFVRNDKTTQDVLTQYKQSRSFDEWRSSIKASQDSKIAYLKNLFTKLLDKLKTSRTFRESIGLEIDTSLYKIDVSNENAYPDLDLPIDPSDPTKNTEISPGFFFYTQKNKKDIADVKTLEESASYKRAIENSMQFQEYLQEGIYSGSQELLARSLQGVDIVGNKSLVTFEDIAVDFQEGSERTKAKDIRGTSSTNSEQPVSVKNNPRDELNNLDLSIFGESTFSKDVYTISEGDIKNYLARTNRLKDQLKNYTDEIFGSRYGYLKNELKREVSNDNLEEIESRYSIDMPEYINKNFIQDIVKKSGEAYLSKRESIERAYPTFKLYLIEEDTQDSDNYYVFDDFYSYSSVKDFTVHKSRKLAADTAVIRLQNISGSLDGTKRTGKRDIDIEREEERFGFTGNAESISSIVLRPGVNAQLRVGYDSNPNKLEIMLSGQITDVSWSTQGDMCEVTLQSYGVELESIKLGGVNNLESEKHTKFQSTHTLLGYLTLRDELKHFGRHREGRLVQILEDKETVADKTIYTPDVWKFTYTNAYINTLNNNALWLTLGLGAVSLLFPWSRLVIGAGRFIGGAVGLQSGGRVAQFGLDLARRTATKVAALRATGGVTGRIATIALPGTRTALLKGSSAGKAINTLTTAYNGASTVGGGVRAAFAAIKAAGIKNSLLATGSAVFLPFSLGSGPLLTVAATGVAGLFILDNVVNAGSNVIDTIGKSLNRLFTPKKKLLKLSPQDDNIFAPHPKRYIDTSIAETDWLANAGNSILTYLNLRFGGLAAGFQQETIESIMKDPIKYFDKRFIAANKEHVYDFGAFTGGKTVWEIFTEMSYRHPGWVYGARQYGDGLEYRMFFGLPSQKYWARDLPPSVIDRLNKIYLYVKEDSSRYNYIDLMENDEINRLRDVVGEGNVEEAAKKILFAEWMKRTESRMKPFRNFHHISSYKNLISNQIRGKNEKTINTVSVQFETKVNGNNQRLIRTVKAHENIPEEKIRGIQVAFENCKGFQSALRYGTGILLQSAKEMYSGEILITGDPTINPYDVCILDDHYLDMYGPIEVESVTHIFGHETGFITEIKPNALVTTNESVTYTVMNNMIWYDVIREMNEENDANTIRELNEDQREKLISEALDETFDDNETLNNLGRETQEELKKYFQKKISESFESGNITLLEDIFNQGDLEPQIIDQLERVADRALVGGAVISGAVTTGLRLRGSNAFAVGVSAALTGIQLLLASADTGKIITNGIKNPSSYIHKKLFGGDMHAARVSGSQLLQIFPLYKRGMPLLASGFEDVNPKYIWRNKLGEIFNDTSDAYLGFLNRTDELSKMGASDIYDETFNNVFLKAKPEIITGLGRIFGLNENAIRGYFLDRVNNE